MSPFVNNIDIFVLNCQILNQEMSPFINNVNIIVLNCKIRNQSLKVTTKN